ncbi:hypothetical protein H0H81_006323, partial [Sphagnurus paluster]
ATDLFAFQGSQTKLSSKLQLPSLISEWPTLPPDPLEASVGAPHLGISVDPSGESNDGADETSINSLLVISDDEGHLHCFLDGSFPLGTINLGSDLCAKSLFKDPKRPAFFAHLSTTPDSIAGTFLEPTVADIPLLGERHPRDLAKLSSTARELTWYTMRVIKEMHTTWFGSEAFSGARDIGPKWIQALEAKQKDQYGQKEPNAVLDLTALLVTERGSESLLDFLGSGDQMSERGIQKWESTMTEALVKLRDYSEKRIAPACQRLHLVLEELQGWSQLPQFAFFELSLNEINECLDLTRRTIILASWLAAAARRELSRFREFISWLRFETSVANSSNDTPHPRHDILEVNNYFVSGLSPSSIDKWFTGPIPHLSSEDLGLPEHNDSVLSAVSIAYAAAAGSSLNDVKDSPRDLEDLDRNIDALVKLLAARCGQFFHRAAGAACRSAKILGPNPVTRPRPQGSEQPQSFKVQERSVISSKVRPILNAHATTLKCLRLAGTFSTYPQDYFWTKPDCVSQVCFNEALESPFEVGIVLLELSLPEGEDERVDLDLLEAHFLDDESVVIVHRDQDEQASVALFNYSELRYEPIKASYVSVPTREDLMLEVMKEWKQRKLSPVQVVLKQSRRLISCKSGDVAIALNGRQGRRVACVLDNKGTTLESFDLEGEADEMESEADGDVSVEAGE